MTHPFRLFARGVLALFALLFALTAQAAVPSTLNYQGQLSTAAGVPVDGTVSMTFTLYDAATNGTDLWHEMQDVVVSNGQYNILLGSITPLTPSMLVTATHLGIKVASDLEMTPRIALSSAPYAMLSSCMPGDQMDCYTGAAATRNVGACTSGKRTCIATGWDSACSGEVLPAAEVLNGIDDDCNGVVNNGVGCFIGGVGYANGAVNPASSCQVCNIANTTVWTDLASGTVCNDASACTVSDTCDGAGSCVGAPVNVDDGNECTTDSCVSGSGVANTPVANGTVCGGGTCQSGVCAAPTCWDGMQNQGESYIDCGGGICVACGSGSICINGVDCDTGVCTDGLCE